MRVWISVASLAIFLCLCASATLSVAGDIPNYGVPSPPVNFRATSSWWMSTPQAHFETGYATGYGVAAGDLNGDGHFDIVSVASDENTAEARISFCVWPDTVFSTYRYWPNGEAPPLCTVGPTFTVDHDPTLNNWDVTAQVMDYDDDGDNDIILLAVPTIAWIENTGPVSAAWKTHVLSSDFYDSNIHGLTYTARSAKVVKGSYGQDVLLLAGSTSGEPALLIISQSSGGIIRWTPSTADCPEKAGERWSPNMFDLADFNGDGIDDLLARQMCGGHSVLYSAAFSIYLGNGTPLEEGAAFSTEIEIPGANGRGGCAGDFNDDGIMDFVVGDTHNAQTLSKAYIFHGAGDMAFTQSEQLIQNQQRGTTTSFLCHDFDYDRVDDFIIATVDAAVYFSGDEPYGRWENNSPAGSGNHGPVLGDFDGDGLTDVMRDGLTPVMTHNPWITEDPSLDIGETIGTLSDGTLVKCSYGDCQIQDGSGKYVDSDVTTDQLASFAKPSAGEWTPYGSDGAQSTLDDDGNLVVKYADGLRMTYKSC